MACLVALALGPGVDWRGFPSPFALGLARLLVRILPFPHFSRTDRQVKAGEPTKTRRKPTLSNQYNRCSLLHPVLICAPCDCPDKMRGAAMYRCLIVSLFSHCALSAYCTRLRHCHFALGRVKLCAWLFLPNYLLSRFSSPPACISENLKAKL